MTTTEKSNNIVATPSIMVNKNEQEGKECDEIHESNFNNVIPIINTIQENLIKHRNKTTADKLFFLTALRDSLLKNIGKCIVQKKR